MLYGTSDMVIAPGNTIAYYERLQAAYGAGLPSFARLYAMPGLPHGGQTGNFMGGWDYLDALDRWVTKGKTPGPQVVTDSNAATRGRTRPLCEYPAYPRYNGSGNANLAASFTCAMP
jgi:feruloyl esterase